MDWNWRTRRARLLLGVALVACLLALVRPTVAHAGYPLAAQGRVALGFGATYTSAEATSSSVHRGVDLSAETGARVVAPLAGVVTFAGRVPGVGGGTVRAVTISTPSGSITLLPLADVSVAGGDSLPEGEAVGSLAGSGDGSPAGAHLHVGVKRGDLYVDPMSVLTLPRVASESPAGAGAGAAQGSASAAAAAGARAAVGAKAASPSGAAEHGAVGARGPTFVHDGALAGASEPAPVLRPAVPGAHLAPGVTVGGLAPQAAPVGAQAAAQRALAPLRAIGLVPASGQARGRAADSALEAVLVHARQVAGRAARAVGICAATVLGGIGLLWPLWRREEEKGFGEDCVSAITDDIAAAVGR